MKFPEMDYSGKIWATFRQILKKLSKDSNILQQFSKQKIEIGERFRIPKECKGVYCVDLGESFRMTIYYIYQYLIAKFGFDAAENEPPKI